MNSRAWRFVYWVMGWTPFVVFVFGPDDWGFRTELTISAAIVGGLFVLSLIAATASWLITGREPDFEGGQGDRGSVDVPARSFTEPPSHVRRVE